MKTSIPKLHKVKFKNGNEIIALPESMTNVVRSNFGWGEVTFRAFDNKRLTVADCCYMADVAKDKLFFGDE